jgi:hypothetical protein
MNSLSRGVPIRAKARASARIFGNFSAVRGNFAKLPRGTMLVLLSPAFQGTDEQYRLLARATGLLPYDLKTKCKPSAWGVVKVLADPEQAQSLCMALRQLGLPACLVDSAVAHDPERRIVNVRRVGLEADHMVVQLRERAMDIPYAALVAIVRGEAQLGRTAESAAGQTVSSSAFRAINPSPADIAVFREQTTVHRDAFAALDLHFATVLWVARLDARSFEWEAGFASDSPAQDLDRLAELLASRGGARVDRNIRSSSLASFTARHVKPGGTSISTVPPRFGQQTDEHLDAYSRLVAEAERQFRLY